MDASLYRRDPVWQAAREDFVRDDPDDSAELQHWRRQQAAARMYRIEAWYERAE